MSMRNAMREEDEDAGTCVMEWGAGLPLPEDLIPLSQLLITPELAAAFSITIEPSRTALDVSCASRTTLSSLRSFPIPHGLKLLPSFGDGDGSTDCGGKGRKFDPAEEPDGDPFARTLKRPRLVWTPQLHKRFIDVVSHLGVKNAFPKTIMQLMNVEGLTRENVASHLQKYRLYLKRMKGMPNESLSASNQAPREHGVPIPIPYASHFLSIPAGQLSAMAAMRNPDPSASSYPGFGGRDWLGDSFRSIASSYPHVAPSDK
ncbi:PHO85 cyclin-1 [Asimina triloba]